MLGIWEPLIGGPPGCLYSLADCLISISKIFFLTLGSCLLENIYVCHVCAVAHRDQKRVLEPLELELQCGCWEPYLQEKCSSLLSCPYSPDYVLSLCLTSLFCEMEILTH